MLFSTSAFPPPSDSIRPSESIISNTIAHEQLLLLCGNIPELLDVSSFLGRSPVIVMVEALEDDLEEQLRQNLKQ